MARALVAAGDRVIEVSTDDAVTAASPLPMAGFFDHAVVGWADAVLNHATAGVASPAVAGGDVLDPLATRHPHSGATADMDIVATADAATDLKDRATAAAERKRSTDVETATVESDLEPLCGHRHGKEGEDEETRENAMGCHGRRH